MTDEFDKRESIDLPTESITPLYNKLHGLLPSEANEIADPELHEAMVRIGDRLGDIRKITSINNEHGNNLWARIEQLLMAGGIGEHVERLEETGEPITIIEQREFAGILDEILARVVTEVGVADFRPDGVDWQGEI